MDKGWRVVFGIVLVLGVGGSVYWWSRPPAPKSGSSRTVNHWRLAQEALDAQDFVRACEQLRICVELSPTHAETHFILARAYRRADDLGTAVQHLKIAESLMWSQDDIRIERLLARAQIGMLGETEGILLSRLQASPNPDEIILEALIKGYLAVFRLPDANRLATLWLERTPERWQPWLYRGRTYFLNHDKGRAIADYHRALEAKPDLRLGRLWYASTLMLDGRYAEGLPIFQKYAQDYPDDTAGLLGLAECQLNQKQPGEAEATLAQLLKANPKHAPGLYLRGKLELDRNAPEKALVWLNKALESAPHELDIVQGLINANRQLGKRDEVKRYQDRFDELGKLMDRVDELRKKIIRNPKDISLRLEAGALCVQLGQTREALEWLQGALALDRHHKPTHQALARCFEAMGETQQAEYHRAQGKDP